MDEEEKYTNIFLWMKIRNDGISLRSDADDLKKFFEKNFFFEKADAHKQKEEKKKLREKEKEKKNARLRVKTESGKKDFRKTGAALKSLSPWCAHIRLHAPRPRP